MIESRSGFREDTVGVDILVAAVLVFTCPLASASSLASRVILPV